MFKKVQYEFDGLFKKKWAYQGGKTGEVHMRSTCGSF